MRTPQSFPQTPSGLLAQQMCQHHAILACGTVAHVIIEHACRHGCSMQVRAASAAYHTRSSVLTVSQQAQFGCHHLQSSLAGLQLPHALAAQLMQLPCLLCLLQPGGLINADTLSGTRWSSLQRIQRPCTPKAQRSSLRGEQCLY